MRSIATGGTGVRIDLGRLDRIEVQVLARPYVSLVCLLKEVLAATPRGLPLDLGRRIDEGVGRSGHQAMLPLADPRRTMAPSCLFPEEGLLSLAESVAALRDTTPAQITESIDETLRGDEPLGWQGPVRAPQRWMNAVARAVTEVAQVVTPEWRRAREGIDREAERAQRALQQGTFDLFVASLNPRLRLSGSVLSFDDPLPEEVLLEERRLVLIPMLAGPRMLTTGFDDPHLIRIGYPVPQFFEPAGEPNQTYLEQLLGSTRSTLMLCIGQPRRVSDLAMMLGLTAATVSFHCDRLAASDLITRERVGSHVWITRTGRGEELLELMSRTGDAV